jgi:gamma-glutamyltranspeptidase / glutathione hydrolase
VSLVVCPEIYAAKAGFDIFAKGGNAMDAAVGAAFAQGVTNHLLCGIGGTITLYWVNGSTGEEVMINGEETVGSGPVPDSWINDLLPGRAEASLKYRLKSRANEVGYQAIMTPGFVRGCWVAYQRFGGNVPWKELLQPAIRLARDGFDVPAYSAGFWRHFHQGETHAREDRGLTPKWEVSPASRRLMLKDDGNPYELGDRFVQADLANTLSRLADAGGDDFYTGAIADEIAQDLGNHQSLVTAEDLRTYPVNEDAPLPGTYRGHRLSAQPFSNGCLLIEVLQILDRFDLAKLGHNQPEYIALVAKAMRAASGDYLRVHGSDRDRWREIELELTSDPRADYWANLIKAGDPIDVPAGEPSRGTTHLTAADDDGNIVSLNHSIGFGGCGAVTPGLGFLYNGDMASYDPHPGQPDSIVPGKKFQGGSPLALFRDRQPLLVLGAPGGTRIFSSIIQTVLNAIDHGMDIRTAVTAPRFHSQDRQVVYLERWIPERVGDALRDMGHEVRASRYAARPQAVMRASDRYEGGSDPRGQSSADVSEYPPYYWPSDPSGGGG